MRISKLCTQIFTKVVLLAVVFTGLSGGVAPAPAVTAQTCATTTTPATTFGQVTQSVSVATGGTYRVWSRIKAPSTTNNSYYFQVNNGCAVNVGDAASIPVNSWTWVNYQNANTGAFIDISLTAGTHQLTYTGKEADVQLDRILLLSDTTCVPTGTGDNCAAVDATSPSTSITAPANGSSAAVGSTVTINASATDNIGVTKVEFYVNGALKGTDTTAPYSYAWNTTGVTSGSYGLTSRAYDAAGNTSTSGIVSVTLTNANELVLTPTDDATVIEASPTTNYGTSTVLQLDNTPVEDFLIKMSVSGTAGKTIESAKLRLYNVNESDNGGTFYKSGTSWSQGTVNWSTAPAIGTQVAALGAVTANTWYEIDVKSLITGDGTFALRGKSLSTTGNGADYSSLEGANKPQLVITTGTETTPPVAVTIPHRVNTGGPAYTDPSGIAWKADANFADGNVVNRGQTLAIVNTTNDTLYQYERWGMTAYNLPIANGTYKYRLHFAETNSACGVIGCRVMSVTAESSPIVTNMDIFKEVGLNAALIKEGVITVSDGTLNLGFSSTANKPEINGIEILPNDPTGSPDLVVTDITWNPATPATGNNVTFSAVVKNQGTVATPSGVGIGIAFKVNGTKVNWMTYTSQLAAGQSAVFTSTGGPNGIATWSATAGTHTVQAHVDDTLKITESNETNNTFSKTLTIAGTTSLPGDANGDNRVNAIDLSVVLSKDGQNYPAADFNKDGVVGAADMAILLGKWTW